MAADTLNITVLALLESGKFVRMYQVSREELRLIDSDAELTFDVVESLA